MIVKLDKNRNMNLDFKTLRRYKQNTGKSLMNIDLEQEDLEDYVPDAFYAALSIEDKEITLERTIDLIDEHLGIKKSIGILQELMQESTIEAPEESEKNA